MFRSDASTSPHPLMIGAGFDGTGLHLLKKVINSLMHSPVESVEFPAIHVGQCTPESMYACTRVLRELESHGLQSPNGLFQPGLFEDTNAVMGHPVPHFTWDFLEAFPNAKVILTVRDPESIWDTLSRVSPFTGSEFGRKSANGTSLLKQWVWGLPRHGDLNKQQVRKEVFIK